MGISKKNYLSSNKMSIIFFPFLLLVLLASCNSQATETSTISPTKAETLTAKPAPIPVEKLYEHPWVLLSYGNPESLTVLPNDTLITAVFSEDNSLSGFSACNQYQTNFVVEDDGKINIQPEIVTTRMACTENLMDVEDAYLASLPKAMTFGFNDQGHLEMGYIAPDNTFGKMVFVPGKEPLEGTTWTLVSYGDENKPFTVADGVIITADFGAEGTLTGDAACNRYQTTYEVKDDLINIEQIITTRMACENGLEEVQNYVALLKNAQTYRIVGTRLTIMTQDGQVLNYTAATLPLETTLWTLITINGETLPTETSVTLFLTPGETMGSGEAGGTAGCNDYFGEYKVEGEAIEISELGETRMMCDESVMQVESAYLDMLGQAQSYQILGANLAIQAETGNLAFVADRTPLPGALWKLIALGDIENPQEPVQGANFTAQFTRFQNAPTGVVAGTTGCNEYAAAFAASLTEIKINLPDSTDNKTCVPGLNDQEQLYFLALNDATQYRILGDILLIPYDDGKQALVFEATQIGLAQKRPLNDLQGTNWYLWTINERATINGTTITAEFAIDPDGKSGKITGLAGCDRYQATFGDDLGMQTTLNSSEMCTSPKGVMEQEQAYLGALSRAYGYWLTDDQLIINTGEGALTYRMSPPPQSADQTHLLQEYNWYLVSYNTSLSVPGEKGAPNISFKPDGSLVGYTGCNDLSARYNTDINKITITNLSQSNNACPDSLLAKQEKTMIDVLKTAQTYQAIETSMQLVGSAGVMNFYFEPVNNPEEVVPPKAVITAPAQANVGEIVTFSAADSSATVPITNYSWDFGDGSKAQGEVVEHAYEEAGNYLIQMTVTDARGFRNSATMTINISPIERPTPTAEPTSEPTKPPDVTQTPEPTQEPPPEPTQPPQNQPPHAVIQSPQGGYPGEVVSFNAADSQPGSSPIVNYKWDFGDGTTKDTGDQPQSRTIYTHGGSYEVNVLVTDANGLSDSSSAQLTISARLDTDVWVLLEMTKEPPVEGTTITLQFLEGKIAGFASCNSYTGDYVAEDNGDGTYRVEIKNVQSTKTSCPESIMKQEALYLHLLSNVKGARIDGNVLMLNYPEGTSPQGKPYPTGELIFYELGTPIPAPY
jgi:heat shock protein HslJ